MALRLSTILPRVFVLAVVALLATATMTFAAETRSGPAATRPSQRPRSAILLVPDVRGQAYVFAKSTLEEGGFAWRVTGGVQGYAANTVTSQSPAPGSRVYDTGAPTISLGLTMNPHYPQAGSPENVSSFPGTVIQRVGVVVKPKAKPKAKPTAKPKRQAQGEAQGRSAKPKPSRSPSPRGLRHSSSPARSPSRSMRSRSRPGPQRLDRWLSSNRSLTDPNVSYWLYQHAWIVTGAKFGWWHGAQALDRLIQVDQRVQRVWGIGSRSERVARAALAEVRTKSR